MFFSRVLNLLLWCVLVGVLFFAVAPALAQGDGVGDVPPELPPVIDDYLSRVDIFLRNNDTLIVMGAVAFLVIAVLRIVLPDTVADTETIMKLVVLGFTGLYVVANALGGEEWLSRAVQIGAIISKTIGAILALLGVPAGLHWLLGKKMQIPLIVRPQGADWWKLEQPEVPALIESGSLAISNDPLYNTVREALEDHEAFRRSNAEAPRTNPIYPHDAQSGVG